MIHTEEQTTEELCVRCRKNEATLTYANSQMDVIHGFTERICQECYDKQMKESNWYKKGFEEGRKIMEQTNHSQQGNSREVYGKAKNLPDTSADTPNQTTEDKIMKLIKDKVNESSPKELQEALDYIEEQEKKQSIRDLVPNNHFVFIKIDDVNYISEDAHKVLLEQAKQELWNDINNSGRDNKNYRVIPKHTIEEIRKRHNLK